MKILYLAHVRLPTERAHGYATMKMCEEFAAAGHDVELIAPDTYVFALGEKDPFAYYGIERRFALRRIPASDVLGIDDNRGRFSFWIDLLTFVASAWLFCGHSLLESDVIYVRDHRLVPFLPARKTVLEIHDIPASPKSFVRSVRRAARVVVISRGLAEAVRALGVRTDICIAPDAADLEQFQNLPDAHDARAKLGLPENVSIALYTGHFYGWKGADVFAEASRHLTEIFCVLVGGIDEEYRAMEREYASERVRVIPFQPREMMPLYLAAADVLVLPNSAREPISARYTSPLKLFEYMAAGKPIVASDLPSIREILSEKNALLVAPDDPAALAAGIREALAHPEEAAARAKRAREDVQQHSWEQRARTILDFIKP